MRKLALGVGLLSLVGIWGVASRMTWATPDPSAVQASAAAPAAGPQAPAKPSQAASGPGSASGNAAVIDGRPITQAELDSAMSVGLARLDDEMEALRRETLDRLIEERLLDAEAKRRGTTITTLMKTEVDEKVGEPTDAELEAFAKANGRSIVAEPALKPTARNLLRQQRAAQKRHELLTSLRTRAKVEMPPASRPAPRRVSMTPDGAPLRGAEKGIVTIIEFSDYECPFCRRSQATVAALLKKYPTQVRHAFRHLPLDTLHPNARRAAEAAWCAQQQGQFWPVHAKLFTLTGDQYAGAIGSLPGEFGMDAGRFQTCLGSPEAKNAVESDVSKARILGISGTPIFFINGRVLSGAQPLERFVEVIDQELSLQ